MSDLDSFRRYCEQHYRTGSVTTYVSNARSLLEFMSASGIQSFDQVPENLLIHYDQWLTDSGYTPATAQLKLASAKAYLRWVRDLCNIEVAEQRKVRRRKAQNATKSCLEPDEFAGYFVAANEESEPMRSATMLLICTGLRSQELVDAKVDDIQSVEFDLANGEPYSATCVVVQDGKGGKRRTVPMLEEGEEILRQYFDGPWQALAAPSNTRYLFPSKKYIGRSVQTRGLRYAMNRIGGRMGKDLSPHALRRTYLTQLHRIGVDFATISKIAGHEDPKTLYKHYLSMNEGDLAAAVHKRGGRLDSSK